MNNITKMKEITDAIDMMLDRNIDPESEEFISWELCARRVLEKIFGKESDEYKDFTRTQFMPLFYASGSNVTEKRIGKCKEGLKETRAKFNVYISDLEADSQSDESNENKTTKSQSYNFSKVFIVHGHDGELKVKTARLIEKQGIEPIILNEQANLGNTIIEKFELYSDSAGAAICLLTADDEMANGSKRARQNVIFETGYFYGKIGRNRTIIIAESETMSVSEISDLSGVVYVNKNNNWELEVLKELKAIGYEIDFNKLF